MTIDCDKYFVDPPMELDEDLGLYRQAEKIIGKELAGLLVVHGDQQFVDAEVYPHRELLADPLLLHQALSLSEAMGLYSENSDFANNYLFPFAIDDFGSSYCVSIRGGGTIVFYDHDTGSIISVANGLRHFFNECVIAL